MSTSELEGTVVALEEVDERLRAMYRALADDPSGAASAEEELRALHVKRRELAERVGLAMLAERRKPKEAPAPAPEAPISAEVLGEWMQKARTSGVGTVAYVDHVAPTWEGTLSALMTRVGAPRDLDLELADELAALDAVGREPHIGRWSALPPAVAQTWLGMLVARTRAVKDVEGLPQADRVQVKTIISRYPPWAFEHRPGHVHGLKLDHDPEHGSWREDARRLWSALDAHFSQETLARRDAPKKRKKPDDEPAAESAPAIGPDWALWPLVRGKNVVMLGGDPREPNRDRLEKTFELASLDWPDIAGPRKVDAVVARIRRRSIDIVLLLQGFVDHKQSEPIIAAAKEADVAWAMAEGYGAASIKAGLDRFLSRSA